MGADETFESGDHDRNQRRFEQIIGNSPALESVLEQVERVGLRIPPFLSREKQARARSWSRARFTLSASGTKAPPGDLTLCRTYRRMTTCPLPPHER